MLEHVFEEYLEIARKSHGAAAPGVFIGGFMVDTVLSARSHSDSNVLH